MAYTTQSRSAVFPQQNFVNSANHSRRNSDRAGAGIVMEEYHDGSLGRSSSNINDARSRVYHRGSLDTRSDRSFGRNPSSTRLASHTTATGSSAEVSAGPTPSSPTIAVGADDPQQLVSFFSDTDTLRESIRKAIVVAMTVATCAFGLVSVCVWSAVIGGKQCGSSCTGVYVAAIGPFVALAISVVVMLYVRHIRQTTELALDVLFFTAALNIASTAIAVPSFPGTYFLGLAAFLIPLCRTPRLFIHLLIYSIFWWICAVNEVNLVTLGGVPSTAYLPDAVAPSALAGYIYYAVAFVLSAVVLFAFSAIVAMHDERIEGAATLRQLALEVLIALYAYDTDSASRALVNFTDRDREAQSDDDRETKVHQADDAMVSALANVTTRMQNSRRYLPHWALRAEVEGPPRSGAGTPSHGLPPAPAPLDQNPNSRLRGAPAPYTPLEPAFCGRASIASLDFGFDTVRLMATSANTDKVLADFVSATFRHLEASGGSLHSMVGDHIIATFNATSRCANHEIAAANFVVRLRNEMSEGYGYVCGCVAGVEARCQLVGAAGSGASFLMSLKSKTLLTGLLTVAREAQCIVTDYSLALAVRASFDVRAVDAIWVTESTQSTWRLQLLAPNVSRSDSPLAEMASLNGGVRIPGGGFTQLCFQLLQPKLMNRPGEFATYPTISSAEVVSREVSSATTKCVDGLYEEAIQILNKLPLDTRNDAAIQRLLKTAQWCNDKNLPRGYFSRRLPNFGKAAHDVPPGNDVSLDASLNTAAAPLRVHFDQ